MKREIKFRGQDLFKSRFFPRRWMIGGLTIDGEDAWITAEVSDKGICAIKVEPETVGQFIIKTPEDLNKFGKDGNYADFLEIYEDDIVEARCEFVYADGYKGYSVKVGDRFVVTSYEAGFCAVPIDLYESWVEHGRIPNTCRVMSNYYLWNNHRFVKPIGNIYDDTNLLKDIQDETNN